MDPFTMLVVGSKVAGAVGKMRAANHNARALRQQAREEDRATNEEVLRRRDAARKAIGEQLAASFSNGFQGGTGTALDALTESQVNAALDTLELRRQGVSKSGALREEAAMQKRQGRFALVEGLLGAGASVAGHDADWANARAGMAGGGG